MALKHCLSTALALASLAGTALALSDAPPADKFVRRGTARAAVLGHYVYVDGGQVSQLGDDGKIGEYAANQVNSTLSIDMSRSWKAGSVEIRTIPKDGPKKANVQVWADGDKTLYSWGGRFVRGINMTQTELWKFVADGSGGGAWSFQEPANAAVFANLHPGEFSAHTVAGDTGYLVGGLASGFTELSRAKTQAIPGMVTFNMRTAVWENGTRSAGFSPYDTLSGGTAEFVPVFSAGGGNGLIFVLAGWEPRVDSPPDINSSPVFDLANLTFFDPVTRKAYWQTATGDVPPTPRSRHCTVGFANREGGYDIFLFGGINQRAQTTWDDAYLLSLPGFVWTRLPPSPGGNRAEQTCVAVGNRQVLSIGGTDVFGDTWTSPDPASQGLLLFDMTAQRWSDSYDAGAAAYESPEVVKSWYSKNPLDAISWSSDEVKQIFSTATDPGDNSTGNSDNPRDSSSGVSGGAIAGGVVGGVVGAAIGAGLVWFLLRRKKQRADVPGELGAGGGVESNDTGAVDAQPRPHPPELDHSMRTELAPETKYTYAMPHEMGDDHRHEMYAQGGKVPTGGDNQQHELYGGGDQQGFYAELDGSTRR